MNIAYFGSPKIAADLLYNLIKNQGSAYKIACVFTIEDKRAGKRLELTQTEVKKLGLELGIKVYDYELKKNKKEVVNVLKRYKIDLGLVFAYGALIPNEILKSTIYGFWNIHPSLLPRYRGPSPIIYPLIMGDLETGVSVIKMTDKIDSGAILSQKKIAIKAEARPELEKRLIELAYVLLKDLIEKQSSHEEIEFTPQDEKKVTETRLINKEDGFISKELIQKALNNENFNLEELPIVVREYRKRYLKLDKTETYSASITLYNYFRGLFPWPGIWTTIATKKGNKRLKINSLLSMNKEKFEIYQVQIEGKKPVSFRIFNNAYNIFSAV